MSHLSVGCLLGLALMPALFSVACENSPAGSTASDRKNSNRPSNPPAVAIDATTLHTNPDMLKHVLALTAKDAATHLGAFEFKKTNAVRVTRSSSITSFFEDITLEQSARDFRMMDVDRNGHTRREVVYADGRLYARHDAGRLRDLGYSRHRHLEIREEVWSGLRTTLGYLGEHLHLSPPSSTQSDGRDALSYTLRLRRVAGGSAQNKNRTYEPETLQGALVVDAATGIPLRARITAKIAVETANNQALPYFMEINFEHRLRTILARPIVPKDPAPLLSHRAGDEDPLAFLGGTIRTSTVIGGQQHRPAQPQ